MTGAKQIWRSAGLHLVERQKSGWLSVTDNYLRAYFTRPEVHPVEESCDAEHALFEKLMATPFAFVGEAELNMIKDADAADNYRLVLRFRDHLAANGTVEAGYASLFSAGPIALPPVFIDQMVHLILAGMLGRETDPFVLKAAETFFREQKATTDDGQLMLADAEIVDMYASTSGLGGLGSLLVESGTPLRDVSLDILSEENADYYFTRSDRFDFALDFRFGERGPDALARVIEKWIRHFHGVDVRVQAMQSIRDERWSWHVGLDAEATRILNALYEAKPVTEQDIGSIAGLFRIEFPDRTDLIETMRGKPVYLGMAVGPKNQIKLKPQNLLTGLPLASRN